jgi:hypothetical protein
LDLIYKFSFEINKFQTPPLRLPFSPLLLFSSFFFFFPFFFPFFLLFFSSSLSFAIVCVARDL